MVRRLRSRPRRALATLLGMLVAFTAIPVILAQPAGAACPTLGPLDHWIAGYTIDGSAGSSFYEMDFGVNGTEIYGSLTSLNDQPTNPNSITGTLSCDHVSGTVYGISPGSTHTYEGTLAANGNELVDGTWIWTNAGGSVPSGRWSAARVIRSAEATNVTELTTDPDDSGATPAEPLQVSMTIPTAGDLGVQLGTSANPILAGYQLLDQVVHIDAPDATPDEPMVFQFVLDGSTLFGAPASEVQLFRNGALLPDCAPDAGTTATPDPCVALRVALPGGDVQVTVRTSSASIWSFGVLASRGGLRITTANLQSGQRGHVYSATLAAVGGVPPYKWKKVTKLPKGLKLKSKTGVISGTPTDPAGSLFVTFKVIYKEKVKHQRAVLHSANRVLLITVT